MAIRWIDAGEVPYYRSQSLYHGLGHAMTQNTPDTVVVATPRDSYICIGNFQDPNLEIDQEFCEENNLPVIRRQTGGGAVLIDRNQLFIQWIFKPESLPSRVSERFDVFMEPLIETHKFFGIDAYFHPANDVHVGGRKIVGTGAATIGNAEVVTGNFLFDFNHELMAGALKLPVNSLRPNVHESLQNYMTTIKEQGATDNVNEWKKVYFKKFEEILGKGLSEGNLSQEEQKEIELWDKKLTSPMWTQANKKRAGEIRMIKIQANFWIGVSSLAKNGKTIHIQVGILENHIEFLQVEGIEMNGMGRIADVLTGVEIDSEKIKEKLKPFESVGDDLLIKPEEWLTIILKVGGEKKRLSGHG